MDATNQGDSTFFSATIAPHVPEWSEEEGKILMKTLAGQMTSPAAMASP